MSTPAPPRVSIPTQKVRGAFRHRRRLRQLCAPWATAATICIIAATTSRTSPRIASLKKWRTCCCTASCRPRQSSPPTKPACALRSLPAAVKQALELLPPSTHPMDVLRTGVSVLGCVLPEATSHKYRRSAQHRRYAARFLAVDASLLAPLRAQRQAHRGGAIRGFHRRAFSSSAPRRFARASWAAAMQASLILYAEHEFNASTFTARVIAGTGSDLYSCIAGAIGALKGPKHGGANEVALEIQRRYATADEAEADIRRRIAEREVIIGFGHPGLHHQRSAQQHRERNRTHAGRRCRRPAPVRRCRTHRERDAGSQAHVSQSRLVQRGRLSPDGHSRRFVYTPVRDGADFGLVRARHRTAGRRKNHPAFGHLYRAGESGVHRSRRAGIIGIWICFCLAFKVDLLLKPRPRSSRVFAHQQ